MRDMTRRRSFAAILGVLALLPVVPVLPGGSAAAAPPASRQRLVLNDVHTDTVDVRYADGALRLQTRVGSPPYEFHAPQDVLFQLKDIDGISRFPVPDLPDYAFLGEPGQPVWLAPETQDPALLFAGWDTEGILPGALRGDVVELSLVDVAGPGRVEVFQNDPAGLPIRIFSSTAAELRTSRQSVSTHVHANWAFTAVGRYRLTFEVRAVTAEGTAVAPVRATYTWYIGGTQAGDVQPESTQTALSASPASPSAGDQVTLTAAASPTSATGWVEFFDGDVSLGFTAVSAGTASLSTSDLAAGSHTLTARYTPTYANDYSPSVSPPVTLLVQGGGTTSPSPSVSGSPSPSGSPSSSGSSSVSPSPSAPPTSTNPSATPPAGTQTASASPRCVPVTQTSTRTTTTEAVVLNQGHVDYAARLQGGQLTSQVKDGTVAGRTTWRDPSDAVFHLKSAARTTIPASGFGFLGPAGSAIWQIPQSQQSGLLWLGWNTEEIQASQLRGPLVWSLDKVEGPGRLAVYLFETFGQPRVVFNSGDGLPDRYTVPVGTHAHGNWAFTKEGSYRLTFTHRATLADGRQVSDTAVVTFAVGNTDPRPLARRTSSTVLTYTGNSCGGPLALTGFSLIGPLVLGTGLIAAGTLAVAVTRRRRRS